MKSPRPFSRDDVEQLITMRRAECKTYSACHWGHAHGANACGEYTRKGREDGIGAA